MKTLNYTSKKAQNFIRAYFSEKPRFSHLSEVYKTYSKENYIAYLTCRRIMQAENGNDFRIISYNTFSFTVAWITVAGLRIETAQNSYLVELPF